ncbi:hypothetical protein FRB97_004350 [Tulasnella sp. 331]|nr:hypothetical protein FRB97_004350 [Tulasnella sp. 331]
MPAINPKNAKYLQLFVLALATIIAGVELGLTIYERVHINALRGTSITHVLDYLIFASGWTVFWGCMFVIIMLVVKTGLLVSSVIEMVYFAITAGIWLAAAILWRIQQNKYGCDFEADMCGKNKTIESIAWLQVLKHVVGTGLFFMKIRAIRARQNEKVGEGYNRADFRNNNYNNTTNMNQRV